MRIAEQLKSLSKETLIYGFSTVVGKFISFFLIPLYTIYISPQEYGIYGLINNTFVLINILLVMALDNSTARWIYDTNDAQEKKLTVNTWLWFYLAISSIAAVLFFFFQKPLSGLILKNTGYSAIFLLMMVALPFNCFITVACNVLRFFRQPKALLLITAAQSLSLIIFNLITVKCLKLGLRGIFLGMLSSYILAATLSVVVIRKWIAWPPRLDGKRLRQMLSYSWPFVPAGISIWLVSVSGSFFLNYYLDQREVGLFQLAGSIASVLAVVVAAFQQAWMPFAFSIMNNENARKVYASVLYVFTCVMCCFCVGLGLFSKQILHLLVAPEYYGAEGVISILAYNYFFSGLLNIANLGPSIVKKTKPLGAVMVASAALIIVFNLLLIPFFGKEGAALATCLAQLVAVVLLFYFSQRFYPIPYNFKDVVLMIGTSVAVLLLAKVITVDTTVVDILFKSILFLSLCGLILFQQRRSLRMLVEKLMPRVKV